MPNDIVPLAAFAMIPLLAIGVPIARAYARRIEKSSNLASVPPDVTARLERMEQSIDSIAVEIERISEGQRFTTKLLSDRTASERLPRADSGTGSSQ